MSFQTTVIATPLPALIASLAQEFLACAKEKISTTVCITTTYKQARENRARYEGIAEELRNIWRDANQGNEAYALRELRRFAIKHRDLDRVATHRMLLAVNWKCPDDSMEYTVTVRQADGSRRDRLFVTEDDFCRFLAENRAAVLAYTTPGGEDEERLGERIALVLGC